MIVRDATEADLPAIVAIYNAAIPGRAATADTQPVTVEERREWFAKHEPARRPLWVAEIDGEVAAWIGRNGEAMRGSRQRAATAGCCARSAARSW